MPVTVRVRGIYATALTLLLRRRGYLIVDVSKVLQERLGIPLLTAPASVTVKSTEQRPDDVLVFAYPWDHGEQVTRDLVGELQYLAVRRSRYGNNTVVVVNVEPVEGGCRVTLPDGRRARPRDPGLCSGGAGLRLATIVHDPPVGSPGEPVVSGEVRVVGYYAILSHPGESVSYSEHIRDSERLTELLIQAGDVVDLKQYHVHFRSNAKSASLEEVRAELERLKGELEQLLALEPREPGVVRWGEYLALLTVPRPAKDKLDQLRGEVVPTVTMHHSLKSFGDTESRMVDCAESAASVYGKPQPPSGAVIAGFLVDKHPRRTVVVDHVRPDRSRLRLGPFNIESVRVEEDRVRLVLTRVFRTPGILDGLDIEKRPGDRARTLVDTSRWYTIHEYTTPDGRLLGVYANINTPAEVGLGRVKYLDLYIDVVKRPGSPAVVIDREELEKAREAGLISERLYEAAVETADRLVRKLDSEYP